MTFSNKKYVSKEHKKGRSISTPTGTYTKIKSNSNYCKNCPHRPTTSLTPSSSSSSTSSNSSSKGLISRLPKQKSTKKLHKIL